MLHYLTRSPDLQNSHETQADIKQNIIIIIYMLKIIVQCTLNMLRIYFPRVKEKKYILIHSYESVKA